MEDDPVNNLRRHRKNRHCGSFSIGTGTIARGARQSSGGMPAAMDG